MSSVVLKTGTSSSVTFDVTGAANIALIEAFAAKVATATSFVPLTPAAAAQAPAGTLTVYQIQDSQSGAFTMPKTGGYLEDLSSGATTVTGSGAGDSVIVYGTNAAATYLDQGGNNEILFANGNNHYVGGAGKDTIVGGSGSDSINTGAGNATVYAGAGKDTIGLNDTVQGGPLHDYAQLDQGNALVFADGSNDGIVANAAGQTILGGTGSGLLSIVLNTGNGLTAASQTNDIVGTGGKVAAIYDFTSGNQIYGGSGSLFFVPGASISAAVVGAATANVIFGNAGDSIAYFAQANQAFATTFVAGAGNETLDGSTSQGDITFWAYAGDSTNPMTSQSISGGAGNDVFVTGSGNETINGGAGNNLFFVLNDTAYTGTTNIVLADFGSSSGNEVSFTGYAPSQVQDALDNATVGSSSFTIALGNSTITFDGVQSLNGHIV